MKENGTKILAVLIAENLSLKKLINNLSTEISKRIGILYKYRRIIKPFLLKQLYFSFIHCHLNYENIAWASIYKIKLEGFFHAQPLLYDKKALNIFQINLFHIVFFMFK